MARGSLARRCVLRGLAVLVSVRLCVSLLVSVRILPSVLLHACRGRIGAAGLRGAVRDGGLLVLLLGPVARLLPRCAGMPQRMDHRRAAAERAASQVTHGHWDVRRIVVLAFVSLLGACASPPMGPSVMVLPARGIPFEQFQLDDASCREWALHQSAGSDQRQYDFAYQQCM